MLRPLLHQDAFQADRRCLFSSFKRLSDCGKTPDELAPSLRLICSTKSQGVRQGRQFSPTQPCQWTMRIYWIPLQGYSISTPCIGLASLEDSSTQPFSPESQIRDMGLGPQVGSSVGLVLEVGPHVQSGAPVRCHVPDTASERPCGPREQPYIPAQSRASINTATTTGTSALGLSSLIILHVPLKANLI